MALAPRHNCDGFPIKAFHIYLLRPLSYVHQVAPLPQCLSTVAPLACAPPTDLPGKKWSVTRNRIV